MPTEPTYYKRELGWSRGEINRLRDELKSERHTNSRLVKDLNSARSKLATARSSAFTESQENCRLHEILE